MTFEFSVEVDAPQKTMWRVMTDHVRWCDWMPASKVVLEKQGAPERNGLGAVRVFKVAGGVSASREEVVGWESPHSMSYILHSSFPMKNYRSTMKLIADGPDRCRLFWKSNWQSAIPTWLGAKLVRNRVQKMLKSAAVKMATAASQET